MAINYSLMTYPLLLPYYIVDWDSIRLVDIIFGNYILVGSKSNIIPM